jgi:hypothetical protein
MARRFSLVLVTAAVLSPAIAGAQTTVDEIRARIDNRLRDYAQGALTVLGFSVVPSETASTLAIDSGEPDDFGFVAGQFGGAFTVSDSFPLYLEGFLGYSRYDPDFVFNATGDDLTLPGKWTGFSATGGVGWDFPLTDRLTLRPMANIALGHVESDVSVIGRIIESETGLPTGDFEDGRVSAYGYGGSVMLDFEDYTPEREIDVELRYTHIRLESFDASVERLETRLGRRDSRALVAAARSHRPDRVLGTVAGGRRNRLRLVSGRSEGRARQPVARAGRGRAGDRLRPGRDRPDQPRTAGRPLRVRRRGAGLFHRARRVFLRAPTGEPEPHRRAIWRRPRSAASRRPGRPGADPAGRRQASAIISDWRTITSACLIEAMSISLPL